MSVENDENDEWNEEEDGDDEDQVKLVPKQFHAGQADHAVAILLGLVIGHCQDGSSEAKRNDPCDQASHASLGLGPHLA